MILNQKRKEQIFNLLAKLPDSEWDNLERIVTEQLQPKELEIHTYLQKMYEDDTFCLIANFEDGTDNKLDFIEFTDKRQKPSKESVWDNAAWWEGVLYGQPESESTLDKELLPVVKQFLKQILNDNNKMKTFEIWTEGYNATGGAAKCKFHGTSKGVTFRDAVKNMIKTWTQFDQGYFNEDELTWWGCKFYDNHKDASESFG